MKTYTDNQDLCKTCCMISYVRVAFKKWLARCLNSRTQPLPELVLWAPVSSISFFVQNSALPPQPQDTLFWEGDWDLKKIPLQQYSQYSAGYKSMWEIFSEGKNYKDCAEYKLKSAELKTHGRTGRNITSLSELERYFDSLIELEKSLRTRGYLTQEQLSGNTRDEIGFFVGREGELIKAEDKFGGTHRFALSQILKLEKIPVSIRAIHPKWLIKIGIKSDSPMEHLKKTLERAFTSYV